MAVLELLTSENVMLLVGYNVLFVLDLRFDVVDHVQRLDLKSNCLPVKVFTNNCMPLWK
jgi:hypothetical protein